LLTKKNWRRSFIVLMAGLMAAVWAAVILTHYRAEEAELQDARRQTAFLASLFAKHAVAKFGDIDQTLRVLRNIWTERPLQLSVHLKPYGDSMGNAVLQTSVINAQGFLVFSTLGLPDKPLYLGDREHFKVHQASGQDTLFVSRPVLGRVSGEWSIQLTRPILNHGKFAGVMVTSVDPNYFSDFYNEANSQLRSRATLVRDTGEVLIASNAVERYVGTVVKPSPYTDPGAPLRGNFRRASQFDGIENLYSYVRLPAYGLTAVVGYGVDEILAPAHNLQRERTGRALMVTLFTLLMSVLLLRSLQHQEAADQSLLESQHRLQASHALLQNLSEDVPGVIYQYQRCPKGRYSFPYISHGVQALFNLTPAQVQDQPELIFAEIHPDDLKAMQAGVVASAHTLQPWQPEFRLIQAHGVRWLAGRAQPKKLDDGSILWHGFMADVTDSKQTEAALQAANDELESFSYSVSHDLRSPLSTVSGFSGLLAKRLKGHDDDKAQYYLSRIQLGVTKMSDLIVDLLTLAQVARTRLKHERVDLSALARHIAHNLQASQPERQVVLHIETGLQARGDAGLLRAVLENLLNNAWKYSAKQAAAEIRVGQQTDAAGNRVFFVQDNGAGFDMAFSDKLFQPFERLHTEVEFAGTGVGLATVSRIITRHGGRVWAKSAPGLGATFYFTLG